MNVSVLTPPAEEPVSLAEAKAQIRLQIADDDAAVTRKIKAARERCEAEIARAFVTTSFRLRLDGFNNRYDHPTWYSNLHPIAIPRADLIAVSAINYINSAGVSTVLAPSNYTVIPGAPGWVFPSYGHSWPSARSQPGALTVDFTAGYGTAANVPAVIKEAVLMLMGHLYENREATTDLKLMELPLGVRALLAVEGWGYYAA